jgi:glycosyltransferase involved in cell wall biosynthesis
MGHRRRIGYLTSRDARDPASWSGTPYFMARALQRHCGDVEYLGPVRAFQEMRGRVASGLSVAVRGRRRAYHHSLGLAREYGRIFERRLHPNLDLIVAPAASTEIACLDTRIPIVYTSDATFERMLGYHPGFTNLAPDYEAEGHEVERLALRRAALVLYPSEWAAESARRFYGVEPERVHVFPYGANLEVIPPVDAIRRAKSIATCRILFLGVNWERKGGPVVYEAVRLLRDRGIDAQLTICGSVPPDPVDPTFARVIPRLDKRRPEEASRLSWLLLHSSFLVLPTRNDCFGIVFCEASAHGTPSIAPRTGGVPAAVTEGQNGVLLDTRAGPAEYAATIERLFFDRPRYENMVRSSRAAFEDRLNWDRWGKRVSQLMDKYI